VPAASVPLCLAYFNIPLALPRNRDKLFKGGISMLFKEKILLKSQRAALRYGVASLFSAGASLLYGNISFRYGNASLC